jgi:hypothetical protein
MTPVSPVAREAGSADAVPTRADGERIEDVRLTLVHLREEMQQMRTALQRIVDWSDCQCEHDTQDCCANCNDLDFHCPGCIAARGLDQLKATVCGEEPR